MADRADRNTSICTWRDYVDTCCHDVQPPLGRRHRKQRQQPLRVGIERVRLAFPRTQTTLQSSIAYISTGHRTGMCVMTRVWNLGFPRSHIRRSWELTLVIHDSFNTGNQIVFAGVRELGFETWTPERW